MDLEPEIQYPEPESIPDHFIKENWEEDEVYPVHAEHITKKNSIAKAIKRALKSNEIKQTAILPHF